LPDKKDFRATGFETRSELIAVILVKVWALPRNNIVNFAQPGFAPKLHARFGQPSCSAPEQRMSSRVKTSSARNRRMFVPDPSVAASFDDSFRNPETFAAILHHFRHKWQLIQRPVDIQGPEYFFRRPYFDKVA